MTFPSLYAGIGLNPGKNHYSFFASFEGAKQLQSCRTLCNPMEYNPLDSSVHGDSPGKNTGVDCHALLQGIFPTQGLNPCLLHLLHWQVGSLPLAPLGSPTHSTQSVWVHMCVCVRTQKHTHTRMHTHSKSSKLSGVSQAICGLCLKVTQQAPRKRRAWSKKLYISSHFFKHWKIHLALRNEQ